MSVASPAREPCARSRLCRATAWSEVLALWQRTHKGGACETRLVRECHMIRAPYELPARGTGRASMRSGDRPVRRGSSDRSIDLVQSYRLQYRESFTSVIDTLKYSIK